jgi:hypothetical protein
MEYVVEMASGGMYIPSFMKIGTGVYLREFKGCNVGTTCERYL